MADTGVIGILGCGNMGAALARGLVASKTSKPQDLLLFDIEPSVGASLQKELGAQGADGLADLYSRCNLLVLAIKPQVFSQQKDVFSGLQTPECHTIVSLMAGMRSQDIREAFPKGDTVVRVMPNLPLSVGQGITAIETDGIDKTVLDRVEIVFQAVGDTVRVAATQMDAVTGLSGSGPMYVFEFLEGLTLGGVKAGLPRETSQKLALQTLRGALELLQQKGGLPSEWSARVCSPGGTTVHALHVLEAGGFKANLMAAVEAATRRSSELGG